MNAMALHAYAKTEIDEGVSGASPLQLILMLYDGAIKAIVQAKGHMVAGHVAEKGEMISQAIGIVEIGLKLALDKEKGGEIAQNLSALYDYISNSLLYANFENDTSRLDEASRLLLELRGAWSAIGQNTKTESVESKKIDVRS